MITLIGCRSFILAAITCFPAAFANAQGTAEERAACEKDGNFLCGELAPDQEKIRACMMQHFKELSDACQATMSSVDVLEFTADEAQLIRGAVDAGTGKGIAPAAPFEIGQRMPDDLQREWPQELAAKMPRLAATKYALIDATVYIVAEGYVGATLPPIAAPSRAQQ